MRVTIGPVIFSSVDSHRSTVRLEQFARSANSRWVMLRDSRTRFISSLVIYSGIMYLSIRVPHYYLLVLNHIFVGESSDNYRQNGGTQDQGMSILILYSQCAKILLIMYITDEELNSFIADHRKFILSSAYKATGRFVSESDDEYSVALIAFNEAVKAYEEDKGDFHAFAALVIKRRLIDYLKSNSGHQSEILTDPAAMDGDVDEEDPYISHNLEVRKKQAEMSEETFDNRPGTGPMRDEIEAVQKILSGYGFSFSDLAECSPKAEKTKEVCAKAVAFLLKDHELIRKMQDSKTLPIKEIEKSLKVPRKILERHRRFIIASTEILNGEYPLLGEYMSYVRRMMET